MFRFYTLMSLDGRYLSNKEYAINCEDINQCAIFDLLDQVRIVQQDFPGSFIVQVNLEVTRIKVIEHEMPSMLH